MYFPNTDDEDDESGTSQEFLDSLQFEHANVIFTNKVA